MALQINLTPVVGSNGNGMPTTQLDLSIDLTSIMSRLSIYNLLLNIKLTVNSVNVITNLPEVNSYEFAQMYTDITDTTVEFSTIVWGDITDTSNIIATAEAVLVNKS